MTSLNKIELDIRDFLADGNWTPGKAIEGTQLYAQVFLELLDYLKGTAPEVIEIGTVIEGEDKVWQGWISIRVMVGPKFIDLWGSVMESCGRTYQRIRKRS